MKRNQRMNAREKDSASRAPKVTSTHKAFHKHIKVDNST